MAGDTSSRTEEFNKMLVEAFETRKFEDIVALFADDATILAPRRGAVSGRENIQSFWSQATRIKELEFDTLNVAALGDDVVREIGTLVMRVGASGKRGAAEGGAVEGTGDESKVLSGNYLFIWKRTGPQWYLDTGIWNTRQQPDEAQGGDARREKRRAERRAGRRAERRTERREARLEENT